MDRKCSEFERHRDKLDTWFTKEERRAWEAHLAHCPACRDQWAAEEALDSLFSEAAPPILSSRFNENLHQRIAVEPKARNRWPLLVMQGYWLAASLIIAFIFLNMEGVHTWEGFTMVIFLLFCFVSPIFLLGRKLGFGLFDLILSTMEPPEKPSKSFQNGILS